MKKIKKLLVISILVALASQVNLGLSESNFVVSAGVIIFANFIYYNKDINLLYMGIFSGAMVYLMRLSVYQITNGYNSILLETMIRESKSINKQIEFEFIAGENFYKHYYLMSVLRNLIMNSMDAISEIQLDAKISIVHSIDEIDHAFQISDNGTGIDEDDIKEIFSPGFSTKINYETGEINRGLGLI